VHAEGLGGRNVEINSMVTLYLDGRETPWRWGEEVKVAKGATVRLVATPKSDYSFLYWENVPAAAATKNIPKEMGDPNQPIAIQPEVTFILDNADAYITAEFAKRPGGDTLDLLADYKSFLRETGLAATEEEIAAFDQGTLKEFTQNMKPVFTGDGTPDIVVFALVNGVLKSRSVLFGPLGGISSGAVWKNYRKNLEVVGKAIPMASPAVQRAVAVYSMVSFETSSWVKGVITDKYGVDMTDADLDTTVERWVEPDANADCDDIRNIDEWKRVLETTDPNTPMEERLQRFVQAALDGGLPEK
jgi:hypothetical protein